MTQIPSTQYAIQIIGKEEFVANPTEPVDPVGPTQIMLEVEAYDICFSSTKLLHRFDDHPCKSDMVASIGLDTFEDILSYYPSQEAVMPGHESVVCVVQVGGEVTHFEVDDHLLVQTDWKHLRTAKSNGAFGYNFDGALEEYVVVDERYVAFPDGGEFLIHVSEGPSAAAVGLIEPWTTVESFYAWTERSHVADSGHLLVIGESDIGALAAEHKPAEVAHVAADAIEGAEDGFGGIVFFDVDADAIEKATLLIDTHGTMCVVLGGKKVSRKMSLDIDYIHYDFAHFCGTTGLDPHEGYAWIPANGDLRENGHYIFVGAADPTGVMHTMRAVTLGVPGLSIVGTDLSDERLEDLTEVVDPTAEKSGVPLDIVNTSSTPLEYGYTYATCLMPVPTLVSQAIDLLAGGGILNAFTGILTDTFGNFDLQGVAERQTFMLGISDSDVSGVHTVLRRVEADIIDTTTSLWAITGMAGFGDAINTVMDRTSGGKIMVFPMMHDLGLTPVSELAEKLPTAATKLDAADLQTKETEEALLATH